MNWTNVDVPSTGWSTGNVKATYKWWADDGWALLNAARSATPIPAPSPASTRTPGRCSTCCGGAPRTIGARFTPPIPGRAPAAVPRRKPTSPRTGTSCCRRCWAGCWPAPAPAPGCLPSGWRPGTARSTWRWVPSTCRGTVTRRRRTSIPCRRTATLALDQTSQSSWNSSGQGGFPTGTPTTTAGLHGWPTGTASHDHRRQRHAMDGRQRRQRDRRCRRRSAALQHPADDLL